jgi:hypothetical protein
MDEGTIKTPNPNVVFTVGINVEIGTEAAQFREKEYINGIFVAGASMQNCLLVLKTLTKFSS